MEPLGRLPLPPDEPIVSSETPAEPAGQFPFNLPIPPSPEPIVILQPAPKPRIWGKLIVAVVVGTIIGASGIRLLDQTLASMPNDFAKVTAVRSSHGPIVKKGQSRSSTLSKSSKSTAPRSKSSVKKNKRKPWLSK